MQQKTDAEWNQIRFQNSIGPQIGGLIHDAVALVVAEGVKESDSKISVHVRIESWLEVLYDIAETQKAKLTEVKPLNIKKAVEQGDNWLNNTARKIEETNKKLQETVSEGREREAQDKLNYQ